MEYAWAEGRRNTVKAQVVGEVFEAIISKDGRLTQAAVVEASRKKAAPLHSMFEWDDAVAGDKYRCEQARHIIKAVVVVKTDDDVGAGGHRAFVSVVEDEDRHYTNMARVMTDEDLRRQVLAEALDGLKAWRKKYSGLKELAAVFAEIQKVDNRQ